MTRGSTARLWRAALVVVLMATGAACGDDGDGDGEEGGASTSSTSSTTAPGGSPQESGLALTMKDFAFEPKALTAKGSTLAVNLTNAGSAGHTFTIDDPKIDTTVPAGGTGQVLVALGSKTSVAFYCRFHRASGMEGTITVSP